MTTLASILFALAAAAAVLTIWKSLTAALPAIRALHATLSDNASPPVIHVRTLPTRTEVQTRTSRRHRRTQRPKPVTHRLHQYPHRTHVA
jgi:predicted secreted protein